MNTGANRLSNDADLIAQVIGKSDKKNGKDSHPSVGNYMTA
jgi:hypothetical protein